MSNIILPPGALRLALAVIVVIVHYGLFRGFSFYVTIDGAAVYGFFFLSGLTGLSSRWQSAG